MKKQPAFNCFAAAETTTSDKKAHIVIFSIQHKHKSLYMVNSFMSVSIIAWLAYDINRGEGKHNAKPGLLWKNEFPGVIH